MVPNLTIFYGAETFLLKSSKSFWQSENVVFEKIKSCTCAKKGYCADGRVDGHQFTLHPPMSLRGSVANIKCEARRAELCGLAQDKTVHAAFFKVQN